MNSKLERQAINKWFALEKRSADKKLEFNLSVADVRRLFARKTCYYSGIPMKRGDRGSFSIDRKDNSKGYIIGNVVSCDKIVNNLKDSLTKSQIKKIWEKM